jgi:glyoxylase-like metal-dependent hydrolase (beta-lactamase superfamily II)
MTASLHLLHAGYAGPEEADGMRVGSSVDTVEDISTLVRTSEGLVVCTHAWWFEGGPAIDPYAPDPDELHRSRERILALQPTSIVPGHGPAFTPSA